MDNHTAECSERGPVVGRKNDYGSGSVGSGELAAMRFSLSQTPCLSDLNPREWLRAYQSAWAESGGRAPAKVDRFPPWNLSPEKRREWGCDDAVAAADTSWHDTRIGLRTNQAHGSAGQPELWSGGLHAR
jgi:hypothetical protein